VNLARLDKCGWMTSEEDVWCVAEALVAARHYELFPHKVARELASAGPEELLRRVCMEG